LYERIDEMLNQLEKEMQELEKMKKELDIKYSGYELEFSIPPAGQAPKLPGIPETSNPKIDQELWYLRVQSLMGQDLHYRIEESLDKLRELGVSEEAINWIRQQFQLPPPERRLIPLTGESERFLNDLRERLKSIVFSKFPDAPEDEVEKFIQNAIFNAIANNGWSSKEKIRRSAEGYVRNLLRGG